MCEYVRRVHHTPGAVGFLDVSFPSPPRRGLNGEDAMRTRLMMMTAAAALCAQAVEYRWTGKLQEPAPYNVPVWQGDTVVLAPLLESYGKAAVPASATLYWQTNGMGAAWFEKPADIAPDGRIRAVFHPTNDCGANAYSYFIGTELADGLAYRIGGTLNMRPSPGFKPNTIKLPVPYLDFNLIEYLNAPWLLPSALEGYATEAWVENYVAENAPMLTELDPVALPVAVAASNLAANAWGRANTASNLAASAWSLALTKADKPIKEIENADGSEKYTLGDGVVSMTKDIYLWSVHVIRGGSMYGWFDAGGVVLGNTYTFDAPRILEVGVKYPSNENANFKLIRRNGGLAAGTDSYDYSDRDQFIAWSDALELYIIREVNNPEWGLALDVSVSKSHGVTQYPLLTQSQIDNFAKKSDIPPKPIINRLTVPDGGVLGFWDCGAGEMFVVTTGSAFTLAPQSILCNYSTIPTNTVTHCAVYTVDGTNFINTTWSAPR